MAKIPYLIRRKNIFYFRLVVPVELRESLKVREIIRSLRTENREEATHQSLQLAAHYKAALHDLKIGKVQAVNKLALPQSPNTAIVNKPRSSAPLLSVVIDAFLLRYDPSNVATLTKLKSTLPIFLELVIDKPVNEILQADINLF